MIVKEIRIRLMSAFQVQVHLDTGFTRGRGTTGCITDLTNHPWLIL